MNHPQMRKSVGNLTSGVWRYGGWQISGFWAPYKATKALEPHQRITSFSLKYKTSFCSLVLNIQLTSEYFDNPNISLALKHNLIQ